MVAMDAEQIARFFGKSITLKWRGLKRKQGPFFYPGTNNDEPFLRQFMSEMGSNPLHVRITANQYDNILAIAGKYGCSILCIGGPEEDNDVGH